MKSIKVHINRLGLIRNADIEIKPLMLFSGYSGLGKSYVAILCHYFYYVWMRENRMDSFFNHILDTYGISHNTNNSGDKENVSFSVPKVEIENWIAKDAIDYLRYMLAFPELSADIKVELPIKSQSFSFRYEQELVGVGDNTELYNKFTVIGAVLNKEQVFGLSYRFKEQGITDESPYSSLFRYSMIKYLFGDYNNLRYFYAFPPARGMYMSEFPLFSNAKTGLCQTFISDMQELNKAQEIPDNVDSDLIKLVLDVLAGDVKLEGGQYVYVTHGKTLPISAAAASVREVGPLQQLIKKRDISKCAILIEEPESHLHPLKQIQMADIIALMARGGANMQITTHSDYFLRRLGDLIMLHNLRQKDENKYRELVEEYDEIINTSCTLDPSILSAYYLEQKEEGGDVSLIPQDVTNGIPFDTFEKANDKFLELSALLYQLNLNYNVDGESN